MNRNYYKWIFLLVFSFLFISCSAKVNFDGKNPPPPPKTLFQRYLDGEVSKDEVENWLFSRNSQFRQKIVSMQFELKDRTLNQYQIDRALVLEYDLNTSVHKFNDSNFFWRGYQVSATILAQSVGSDRDNSNGPNASINSIKQNGLSSDDIADSASGTMNSFVRNGFAIERIDLFKYARIEQSKKAL